MTIRTRFLMYCFIVALYCFPTCGFGEIDFYIAPGCEMFRGNTAFQIGNVPAADDILGRDPFFPVSELKYPLDVYMGRLDVGLSINRWSLSAYAEKNINDGAGKMKDSDWAVPWKDPVGTPWEEDWWIWRYVDELGNDLGNMKDIYSESESDLDALILDCKIEYKFYDTKIKKSVDTSVNASFGIGYMYQKHSYDTRLIAQYDLRHNRKDIDGETITIPDLFNMSYAGTGEITNTYEITYEIPYFVISVQEKIGKTEAKLSYAYSPFVKAKDKNEHLIRIPGPITGEGDCEGHANIYSFRLLYYPLPYWFISFNFNYTKIKTTGKMDFHHDAGSQGELSWPEDQWTTDEEIRSYQRAYGISTGFKY